MSFRHDDSVSFSKWRCCWSWLAMSHDLVVELWSCDKMLVICLLVILSKTLANNLSTKLAYGSVGILILSELGECINHFISLISWRICMLMKFRIICSGVALQWKLYFCERLTEKCGNYVDLKYKYGMFIYFRIPYKVFAYKLQKQMWCKKEFVNAYCYFIHTSFCTI